MPVSRWCMTMPELQSTGHVASAAVTASIAFTYRTPVECPIALPFHQLRMAFQLYLRRSPRALVLLGSELVVVISQVVSGEDHSKPPTAAVELQDAQSVSTEDLFKISRGRGIAGILGLTSIPIGAAGADTLGGSRSG